MFGLNNKYRPLNSSRDVNLTARDSTKVKNRFKTKKNSTTYMADGRHAPFASNTSLMGKLSMSRDVSASYRNEAKEKKTTQSRMKKQNKDFLSKYLSKKGHQKIEEAKLDSPEEKGDQGIGFIERPNSRNKRFQMTDEKPPNYFMHRHVALTSSDNFSNPLSEKSKPMTTTNKISSTQDMLLRLHRDNRLGNVKPSSNGKKVKKDLRSADEKAMEECTFKPQNFVKARKFRQTKSKVRKEVRSQVRAD